MGLGVISARNLVRLKEAGQVLAAAERRLAQQASLLDALAQARARGDTPAAESIEAQLDAADLDQQASLASAQAMLDLRQPGPRARARGTGAARTATA